MTAYYVASLKVTIDFKDGSFVQGNEVSSVPVDLFELEPSNTETRLEEATVNMRPANVLHLSAWDAGTLVTVLIKLGWIQPQHRKLHRRVQSLFHNNPHEGINGLLRAAFSQLPAPGEHGAYRAKQWRDNPDQWAALHDAAKSGPQ